jgi:AcrR family transcriptional regulator
MLLGMVEAVADKGYAKTTVADVLTRARASRETFYEHFANKQECFLAAYVDSRDAEAARRCRCPVTQ